MTIPELHNLSYLQRIKIGREQISELIDGGISRTKVLSLEASLQLAHSHDALLLIHPAFISGVIPNLRQTYRRVEFPTDQFKTDQNSVITNRILSANYYYPVSFAYDRNVATAIDSFASAGKPIIIAPLISHMDEYPEISFMLNDSLVAERVVNVQFRVDGPNSCNKLIEQISQIVRKPEDQINLIAGGQMADECLYWACTAVSQNVQTNFANPEAEVNYWEQIGRPGVRQITILDELV